MKKQALSNTSTECSSASPKCARVQRKSRNSKDNSLKSPELPACIVPMFQYIALIGKVSEDRAQSLSGSDSDRGCDSLPGSELGFKWSSVADTRVSQYPLRNYYYSDSPKTTTGPAAATLYSLRAG
eukprot:4597533-Pleurochrysis_carterae.AAC.6